MSDALYVRDSAGRKMSILNEPEPLSPRSLTYPENYPTPRDNSPQSPQPRAGQLHPHFHHSHQDQPDHPHFQIPNYTYGQHHQPCPDHRHHMPPPSNPHYHQRSSSVHSSHYSTPGRSHPPHGLPSMNTHNSHPAYHDHIPPTPDLLRSMSCDSNASIDCLPSPCTPYGFDGITALNSTPTSTKCPPWNLTSPILRDTVDHSEDSPHHVPYYAQMSTGFYPSSRSAGTDDGSVGKVAKRYPCRENCGKTFTTSGHASRHSKIHRGDKPISCSYPGCVKRFTRADNMKQHLETHYKTKGQRGRSNSLLQSPTLTIDANRANQIHNILDVSAE